jgi:(2R)-3-sulfolactate dehydrogenase (NADP+)
MRLSLEAARAFVAGVLLAAGSRRDEAEVMARALVEAEHSGHAGHGLARLPGYVARMRAGGTRSGEWRRVRSHGAVEAYDGRDGLGHVHLELAAARAAELCAEHGIAAVGVSHSNHAGALGPRARRLAERGLVALLATNAPAVLAPPGGHRPVLGTNPLAVAAPVPGGPPLVCDLSTSQVSRGAIMRAAQQGAEIPPGWALDAAGVPTQDPAAALAGTLMPLGGSKGFVLALAVEVLTGGLLGPAVGPEIEDFFGEGLDRPQGVAHLVLALDPGRFGDANAFVARMGRLRDAVLGAGEPEATRLPGARAVAHAARQGDALELDDDLVRMLDGLAAEVGAEPLLRAS